MLTVVRSSRAEVFFKKVCVRNLAKCRGKHLCQSLFCSNIHLKQIKYLTNKQAKKRYITVLASWQHATLIQDILDRLIIMLTQVFTKGFLLFSGGMERGYLCWSASVSIWLTLPDRYQYLEFLVHIFPYFPIFSPNMGKYGPEK